jgi:hypothetical protein
MPILREWRAEIRRELAQEYAEYVRSTGISAYRSTPGNIWAALAVRHLDARRSEIVTLSLWRSMQDIQGFAGADFSRARYFPEDDKYLLTRPESVTHFECDFFGAGLVEPSSEGTRAC